ncbi:MAG: hypothetical protein HYZ91_07230 [Candidatus Omnitrophica bacterium]|nr:hypothetical protein [Candidatus Omnitrophota bacterium]
MKHAARGLTLTEVMIASTLAVVVIVIIGVLDMTRFRMQEDLRRHSPVGSEQGQAALAAFTLGKNLERADRINILSTGIAAAAPTGAVGFGNVQLRRVECAPAPVTPACLDNPASYHWDEYRRVGGALQYFANTQIPANCASPVILAREVTSLTFRYVNAAGPPPGGDPFAPDPADNNALRYELRWDNGLAGTDHRSRRFLSVVLSRAIAYSNVNAQGIGGPTDSGTGIAPVDSVNPLFAPPAACP